MSEPDDRLVDAIFIEALELEAGARERYLRDRCGSDDRLRERVAVLLAASQAAGDGLAQRLDTARRRLWEGALTEDERAAEDLSGRRVGPWQLIERIARGGLATVYRAQRDDSNFDRTVAFKVLRRGLDTDDLIARFRTERQILSSLDHPAIVKMLDGGSLDDGRPYLVLEFVDGLPITVHCEANGVGIRGRVALMIEVLRALHHAHRHLVVHRDVKPSNVLVTPEGKVALLDFGIAKLLEAGGVFGDSQLTRTGVSLLTPGYGSPEQIAGGPITTASDIYQAGLVLYELLAGVRPFGNAQERRAGTLAPKPSRSLGGKEAYRKVRGDLDAIVCKAMHVEPGRRYASADEMLSDLQRYLDGMPVAARPDTVRYRLSKLIKRNPWPTAAAALLVLTLTAYVVTLTNYSQRLARQEQLTAASQEFMAELFLSLDPYAPADEERGRNITVVEALEIGRQRVRDEFRDRPELRASLLVSISDAYGSLGQLTDAIELREEALDIERRLHGERSEQVAISLRQLGRWYSTAGNRARADELLDEQLALARTLFRGDHPELGSAEIAAGRHASYKGDMRESVRLLQLGIDKLRNAPDRYARTLIGALIDLAEQDSLNQPEFARAAAEEARQAADRVFGRNSLQAALTRLRVASTSTMLGDYDAAERLFLEAIPVLEARLGENDESTLGAINNLGFLYAHRGDNERAEQLHRDLLARRLELGGEFSESLAANYQNLAGALTAQGRHVESIPLHERAYEIYRAVLNEDHYLNAYPLLSIAYAELQRDRPAAAEEAARAALAHLQPMAAGTLVDGVAQCLVGVSLERQGRAEEGRALIESSRELMRTGSVPERHRELCGVRD